MNRAAQLWKTSFPRHKYFGTYQSNCGRRYFHRKNLNSFSASFSRTAGAQSQSRQERENQNGINEEFGKNTVLGNVLDNDSIVISGISGRFPNCDSMEELKDNLMKGVDMVTAQDRWQLAEHGPKLPERFGFMKNLDKFDAEFFGVSEKQAEAMDPQQRKLMEVAFEAIIDAGVSPEAMRGTSTGVFVGTMGGETIEYWTLTAATEESEGYRCLGAPNFLQANRLSYALDLKGPSMIMSTGCSASLIALEAAVHSIRNGTSTAAIVAGATFHSNPLASTELAFLNALSPEGKCKSFDESGNGFVRSEAVVAMLIQKKSEAKRNYATIRAVKSSSDGYKKEGITFPSGKAQEKLLRQVYAESGIDPGSVTYFEAHGTGTPAGDPQELVAISNVMCKTDTRKEPLLIGSVKSNMGHAESAAGLCSIAKIVVAIQEGIIPTNLHFNEPNSYVKHVFDGSLKVVDQATPWKGGLIGLSSFGLGGSNVHVVLESGSKHALVPETEAKSHVEAEELQENIIEAAVVKEEPNLITLSGRAEDSLEMTLEAACKISSNPQVTTLLHSAFYKTIPGHTYRGYGIRIPEDDPIIEVEKYDANGNRPLWFIFPGMGSQWNEMGKELMKIDAFSESMRRSEITAKNAGLDLNHLLRPKNPSIFQNIRDSLVAITAVQIALYDTLISLDLKPDGFIGHSSGEILCSYADGCLTAEEALLVGDARGRAFQESANEKNPGGMAAVGLTWDEAKIRCPPGIFPACHNAADNVSISGPLESINSFVKELQGQGVFARVINSCNCAPHSKYVYPAMDLLFKYMNEIYSDERPRSERWISSSIPESRWDTPLALTSSPAYHVFNMGNPVLFYEAVQKIPRNSVVVEIAPHGLFQPLLKGSLSSDCTLVAPMHSMVPDKLTYFYSSVGKLYMAGVETNIGKLFPPVKFPVCSSTPMMSSLVKWDHSKEWRVPILRNPAKHVTRKHIIDLSERRNAFLLGHKLDNRTVFPATGYLYLAWKSYAELHGVSHHNYPVNFQNVSFERATFLKEEKPVQLIFNVLTGTGNFTIEEDGITVVKGTIQSTQETSSKLTKINRNQNNGGVSRSTRMSLTSDDVYKELRLRGYNYSGEFRGIQKIDNDGRQAEVQWKGNWISFLDTVLQTIALSVMTRSTAVPVRFQSMTIDPNLFLQFVHSNQAKDTEGSLALEHEKKANAINTIPVSIHPNLNIVQCPGIEMRGLTAMVIPRQKQKEQLSVEEYKFIPYFDDIITSSHSIVRDNLPETETNIQVRSPTFQSNLAGIIDLLVENTPSNKFKVVDVFTKAENSLTELVNKFMNLKPKNKTEIIMMSTSEEIERVDDKIKALAVTVTKKESLDKLIPDSGVVDLVLLDNPSLFLPAAQLLQNNSHIILHLPESKNLNQATSFDFTIPEYLHLISDKVTQNSTLSLFKKSIDGESLFPKVKTAISIHSENFDWLPQLQEAMSHLASKDTPSNSRIYLLSQNFTYSGLIGMAKCLRMEPGGEKLRVILDPQGKLDLNFENPGPDLQKIIERDLVMNIVKQGKFGSYRHIPIASNASLPSKECEHAFINTLTPGDLTSLRWIESPLKNFNSNLTLHTPGSQGQVCNIHYAALNFRDIMLATGKLPIDSKTSFNPQDCVMGFEFSGVDQQGRRLMGMMSSKAMASSVLIEPGMFTWEIPESWTLQDAATIPIVYATAYYALFNRARIQNLSNPSILIHSGTGGVGQAAINIALDLNCEIYTTVGTPEKRKYIKELFPSLKEENIGHSRDCSFEQMIMERTNGCGVDLVLNSLADDKLQASIRCLAIHGKFLEIGAFDSFQNSNLGMDCFLKNIEFHGIFLNHFLSGSQVEKDILQETFTDGIKRGVVKPLPRHVFSKDQVEEAFRFMAGGKHMGKILIQVASESPLYKKDEEAVKLNINNESKSTPISNRKILAVPRTYFKPDKSYLIVGGLGGLGLEVANFLVDRGARHLILTSRSGVTTGYQHLCMRKWEELGVKVVTPIVDLSSFEVAKNFLEDLTAEGKRLGGIFNSGLVLKDGLIEDQTKENFEAVAAPKIAVTKNLDKLTRTQEYCQDLDYFVVFSSGACGRGNASQSNYGLANGVMEQICEARKEDGLHGLAIQWGVIGEVGFVADTIFGSKLTGEETFEGTVAQRISSCLDILDLTLTQTEKDNDNNQSNNSNIETTSSSTSTFSSIVLADNENSRKTKAGLLETIGHIVGVKDFSNIDPSTKVVDLGIDSLMGMEIKQLIERDYDTPLTAGEIRTMTFGDLLMIEEGTYVKGQSINKGKGLGGDGIQISLFEMLEGGCETLLKLKTGDIDESIEPLALFLVHGTEGHTQTMSTLASKLRVDTYGLQYVGLSQKERLEKKSVNDLAKKYVHELKLVQPEGPYNLAGYSSGGSIVFEMGLILQEEGHEVDNLIILDGTCFWKDMAQDFHMETALNNLLRLIRAQINFSDEEQQNLMNSLPENDTLGIEKRFIEFITAKVPGMDSKLLKSYINVFTTLAYTVSEYEPKSTFRGKVHLVKAMQKTSFMKNVTQEDHGLQKFCEEPVSIYSVEGDHFTFLDSQLVDSSAKILNDILVPADFKLEQESKRGEARLI